MNTFGQDLLVVLGRDRRANALFSFAGLAKEKMAPLLLRKVSFEWI